MYNSYRQRLLVQFKLRTNAYDDREPTSVWIVSPGCSFLYTTGIRYMNAKYDSAASIVVVVSSQTCTVGSQYEEYTGVSDPRRWYLNLQLPANCSGNVTGYTAYYYPISNNGNYRAYISYVDSCCFWISESKYRAFVI